MQTLLTAHSGADGTPDNSLAFIRYALTTGADALEVDVRQNEAGTLILSHDEGDGVPLADAFQLVAAHPTMCINCDFKQPNLECKVAELARSFALSGRVIYSGFVDAVTVSTHSQTLEGIAIYLNAENYVPHLYPNMREVPDFDLEVVRTLVPICKAHQIAVVNIYEGLVTLRMLEAFRREGIGLSVWTVANEREMAWFFARGVHNLTTRHVKLAQTVQTQLHQA